MDNPSFFIRWTSALVKPTSAIEDDARREYILNVLLLSTTLLMFSLGAIVLIERMLGGGEGSEHPLVIVAVGGVAFGLLMLSRHASYRAAGITFILLLWIAIAYTNLTRGADLPMTWMYYALLVFMSGIAISIRFAMGFTILVAIVFTFITYLQTSGLNRWSIRSWRDDGFYVIPDALGFNVSLGVLFVVSWLFSREINRSLKRARESESELKRERDTLEIKVEQRTRELKEEQRERFESLAIFADFGRNASGVLHDLANPLTAMSINLEQARDANPETQKQLLERVVNGTERMASLLRTARTQFSPTVEVSEISVSREVEQAAEILSHLARKQHVKMDLSGVHTFEIHGSPYAFNRILLNLMSNAIEAYDGLDRSDRIVRVRSWREGHEGFVSVEDRANGIQPEIMERLFEPFASSKIGKGGTGMGLATAKTLAERDFHGRLTVESVPGKGSLFTFRFPLPAQEKV